MWEDGELEVLFTQHGSDEQKKKENVELLSRERPIETSQAKTEVQRVPQRGGRAHLIPEESLGVWLEAKSQRTT